MNNLRKNENKTLFINFIVFIVSFLVLSIFLLIPIFENKKPVIEEYIKQKLQQAIDKANKKK